MANALGGVASSRVPWANVYEFAMTGTLLIVTVFLTVLTKADLRFLGTFVIGLILVLLGIAAFNFNVEIAPMPTALQSAWLIIHGFVASLGTGFFALGFALSVVQLLQLRRESLLSDANTICLRFLVTVPAAATLENLAYRIRILGIILWTFTRMAGLIWAESLGTLLGWGYEGSLDLHRLGHLRRYIHARATRGWRGLRSDWLAISEFAAVIFNLGIVNVLVKGLHLYSRL